VSTGRSTLTASGAPEQDVRGCDVVEDGRDAWRRVRHNYIHDSARLSEGFLESVMREGMIC
jgi:hypothetical protein